MSDATSVAIILAAGKGLRMGTQVRKQYLELKGRPVLLRTLDAFDKAGLSRLIVVSPEEEVSCVREKLLGKESFRTPITVISGGAERYDSVYCGLQEAAGADLVLIHDGARPFVTTSIIQRSLTTAAQSGAAVIAVPVKDTIKIAADGHTIDESPDRRTLYAAQTPQTFQYKLILDAFEKLYQASPTQRESVTDDSMVLQQFGGMKSKLVEGSYDNIKITTPQDLLLAERILESQ